MVAGFLQNSTKRNFVFLCDICLIKFEKSMVDTDAQLLNCLESKIGSMDTQLAEIKSFLMKQTESVKNDTNKKSVT